MNIRKIMHEAHNLRDGKAVMKQGEERLDRPGHFTGEKQDKRDKTAGMVNGRSISWGTRCALDSIKAATPVQHNPSGKNDTMDVNRPKPITY